MTGDVLKRAVDLNDKIKKWRSEKKALEELRDKCWGNASEVWNRCFYVGVVENCIYMVGYVSATSAKAALDAEIRSVDKELEGLEKEFEELN